MRCVLFKTDWMIINLRMKLLNKYRHPIYGMSVLSFKGNDQLMTHALADSGTGGVGLQATCSRLCLHNNRPRKCWIGNPAQCARYAYWCVAVRCFRLYWNIVAL